VEGWGCAGDGGYYYVPADYVSSLFTDIHVMGIDEQRSGRWAQEQALPGGGSRVTLDPFEPGRFGQRVHHVLQQRLGLGIAQDALRRSRLHDQAQRSEDGGGLGQQAFECDHL
jgi:hypothetical protein